KTAEAQAAFEKIVNVDPLSQIGLARIYLEQGRKGLASAMLQDIWGTHPSGLLALEVAQLARRAGTKLSDSAWSAQLRDAAAKLTPAMATMHRSPRDVVLMTAQYKKGAIG